MIDDHDMEQTRAAWKRAGTFPANKETVYPDHAGIQEFVAHAGKRVLEYGCGGGSDTLSFLRRHARVWYADVVPENIAVTRQRIAAAGLGAEFVAYPVELDTSWPIPLAAQTMDVVSSHGVLHHIEEPAPVVAEFHRVLKVGGLVYVMLYTETLWAEHARQVELLQRVRKLSEAEAFGWCTDGEGVPYARAYTEAEGQALLEAAGFRVVSAKTYHKGLFRTFKGVKDKA